MLLKFKNYYKNTYTIMLDIYCISIVKIYFSSLHLQYNIFLCIRIINYRRVTKYEFALSITIS